MRKVHETPPRIIPTSTDNYAHIPAKYRLTDEQIERMRMLVKAQAPDLNRAADAYVDKNVAEINKQLITQNDWSDGDED